MYSLEESRISPISKRRFLIYSAASTALALTACAVPPAPIAKPTSTSITETPTPEMQTLIEEVEAQQTEALIQAERVITEVYINSEHQEHLRNLLFTHSTITGIAGFMNIVMETPAITTEKADLLITVPNHVMALATTLDAATLTLFEQTGDIAFDPEIQNHKELFDKLLVTRPMRAVLLALQYAGRTNETKNNIESLGITPDDLMTYVQHAYLFGADAISKGKYIRLTTEENIQPTDYCRSYGNGQFIDGAGIISFAHNQTGHTLPSDGMHTIQTEVEIIAVCQSLIPHFQATQDFFDEIETAN